MAACKGVSKQHPELIVERDGKLYPGHDGPARQPNLKPMKPRVLIIVFSIAVLVVTVAMVGRQRQQLE